MSSKKPWRLFHRTFILFMGLGVTPLLIVAFVFSLPQHLEWTQYKMVVGVLLIVSTISTLCLAGLVVKILKRPLQQLLIAQQEMKNGNFEYRLLPIGSKEMQLLFSGFNTMAKEVAAAAERGKQLAEERSMTKLASQVIHDLRSPLTTLNIASEHLAQRYGDNEEDAECLKLLQLSSDRLKGIAEELLGRRKEMAQQPPTLLQPVIEELLLELKSKFSDKLECETHFHQSLIPLPLTKTEIQRLCGNILTNAVEAMKGIGKIVIHTFSSSGGVILRIEDNGPGMTPDILRKVLQGGFTYGKADGNGVGMTVVREIVEKYNGTIHAESQVGFGTHFIFELPLLKEVE